MKADSKTILVTGIGGNVGQGILRNISSEFPEIRLIGTNTISLNSGMHLCDKHYLVPNGDDPEYLTTLISICKTENVNLVIPSTDLETFILSKNTELIPYKIAAMDFDAANVFVDKYLTSEYFNAHNIPFAESFLPSNFQPDGHDFILKPRQGRGSRGIQINPNNYSTFSDKEYMVQRLEKGDEYTTAFYVDKANSIHGIITFIRELQNGTTTFCKVVDDSKFDITETIQKIVKSMDIKGSCNIQYILNQENKCIPFEINSRISGTNSIRAQFGFTDVKWTVEEYLFESKPSPYTKSLGSALRILMDVIVEDSTELEKLTRNSKFRLF